MFDVLSDKFTFGLYDIGKCLNFGKPFSSKKKTPWFNEACREEKVYFWNI